MLETEDEDARSFREFVVMDGCDGRMESREYFTDLAKGLPKDTVIMASRRAKYRDNELGLDVISSRGSVGPPRTSRRSGRGSRPPEYCGLGRRRIHRPVP